MRSRPLLALLACAISLPGCVGGGFKQSEQVTLDTGYTAAQAAMKDLEFKITETSKDAIQAHVAAEESDKTPVKVDMEAKSTHITEFRIRIGVLGDESQAKLIMDKIRTHF